MVWLEQSSGVEKWCEVTQRRDAGGASTCIHPAHLELLSPFRHLSWCLEEARDAQVMGSTPNTGYVEPLRGQPLSRG